MAKKTPKAFCSLNRSRRSFVQGAISTLLSSFVFTQKGFAQILQDQLFASGFQSNWENSFDAHFDEYEESARTEILVPLFHPETLAYTEQAIQHLALIVDQGGWPLVQPSHLLGLGMSAPVVRVLRERLMISGDLAKRAGISDSFDTYVDAALKRFRARHGLLSRGVLDADTLRAMNISAESRLGQLKINLTRLRSFFIGRMPSRYVVVNIPAAQVEAIEGQRVFLRHTAIVGKNDRRTPVMQSKINEIIVNPYWNVPTSIIRRDIIPLMRKDPGYLTRNNIHIIAPDGKRIEPGQIDWNTEQATRYRLRQDPGKINAMASVKINFPSPENTYMHDTPEQSAFDKLMRFDTSGCVRVRNIRDLVVWILKNTPGWDRRHFEETIKSGVNTFVRVSDPVPLYFVYISAWSSSQGVIQFRNDIYGKDGFDELKIEVPENKGNM